MTQATSAVMPGLLIFNFNLITTKYINMKIKVSRDQNVVHISKTRFISKEAENCTGCDLMYKHICTRIPCEAMDRKDELQVIFVRP